MTGLLNFVDSNGAGRRSLYSPLADSAGTDTPMTTARPLPDAGSTAGGYESALSLATRRVPVLAPGATVASALAAIQGQPYDCATHVAVLADGRLAGVVTLEALLAADPARTLAAVMDADAPRVSPGIDQEHAALKAMAHGEYALAVVDADNRFLGMIPPQRLLAVLLHEHEEDLTRLGGFLATSRRARRSGEEAVSRRVMHRMPWLLVGIVGALLAAHVVSWFDSQLQAAMMIAFFVPGVVYLADAVGTQTETVVVRALSVGIPLRAMLLREVLTGLAIGCVVALLSALAIALLWQDARLALGVGIALFAACSIASVVALSLPGVLTRFGVDPAYGSGPLATVIQDLLSIVIYFLVMSAVLGERLAP